MEPTTTDARRTGGVWWHGVGWALGAEALFAVMRISTRAGARALPWQEVAMARFLGGAVVIGIVALMRGVSLRVTNRRGAWMRSMFGTLSALGTFYALGSPRISVGDVATINATTPIYVALLSAPMLNESVPRTVFYGIALGFAGVAVLLQPSFSTSMIPAAAAWTSAIAFSFAAIWLRRMGRSETSESIAFHMCTVAGCTMFVLMLPHAVLPTGSQALLLALPAISGGLAQVAITRAYGLDGAARISAISFIGIVFTYGLESIMLQRQPQLAQVIGAAMVCLAGLLVSGAVQRRRHDTLAVIDTP